MEDAVTNTAKYKLLVSILIFSGTDGIMNLLHGLTEHLLSLSLDQSLEIRVCIRKNNTNLDTAQLQRHLDECNVIFDPVSYQLVDDGQNSGFGRGHNLNFLSSPSDYFLILNDDLDFPSLDWIKIAIAKMRSDLSLALIGDISNPSSLNPIFANGAFPQDNRTYSLRYAEASILLANSSAFVSIGMFDETITWAMGEDSDLSFKAQQSGYKIDWLEIPHRHFRSTSFNSLPPYQKSSILEHNRARLFAKWGTSFETGKIGKFEVFDLYSDGLGDMLCSLLHVRAEYERLPTTMHDKILVNVGNIEIAKLVLPETARITSVRDIDLLRESLLPAEFASVRTIRTTNYALPFNIHPLIAGSLSLPLCDEATLSKIAESFKSNNLDELSNTKYTVLHLEFGRTGHHGRGPQSTVIKRIVSLLGRLGTDIVVVGNSNDVPIEYFNSSTNRIVNLQGKLNISELISVVSNATYFVGIDSFPFHVAQVAGIKSSVFFGSVNPLMRVLKENTVWPIVAKLDCVGCYHDQIEPGAPFCMRMNDQCTYDIGADIIQESLDGLTGDAHFDWTSQRKIIERKQARLIEYIKFHPAPTNRLFSPVISNQQISELIYEFSERVSSLYGRHASAGVINQLKNDNLRLRAEVLDFSERAAQFQQIKQPTTKNVTKLFSANGSNFITSNKDCALAIQEGYIKTTSSSADPQIEFAPFFLNGKRFGATITAEADTATTLSIYWRFKEQGFSEDRCQSFAIGTISSSRTWWFGGDNLQPIYIRLDPSSGPADVTMKITFFGDIDTDAAALEPQPSRTGKSGRFQRLLRRIHG